MANHMQDNKQDKCEHQFAALGFDVFKTTNTTVEAVAAIFCMKCGLFRTKILTFRREFQEANQEK